MLAFSFLFTACDASSFQGKMNQSKQTALLLKEDVPSDFIPQDLTIVSVGDSLTQGVGDSANKGGYLPYLQAELEKEKGVNHTEFYNFGVKGNRTDQLIKRLQTTNVQAGIEKADIVIITIGGNDVMKVVRENFSHLKVEYFNKAKRQYENNLHEILQLIRTINEDTMIVLVGLYNPFYTWFSDVKELDEIIDEWNETSELIIETYEDAYFVKIADLFEYHGESLLYTDYFHPNDKGYELIASRLFEKLDGEVIGEIADRNFVIRKEETTGYEE